MSPVLLSELAMNVEGPKAEADTAKQIIALSTGAVAFTVTFLEKFKTAIQQRRCLCRLASMWHGYSSA